MGIISHPAAMQPPPAAISRILSHFSRDQLEGFVAVAIDLMDVLDGDTDLEDNNDREAQDGDDQGDQAWIEWHTRGSHKLRRGIAEPTGTDRYGNSLREDDEDDDPAEEAGDESDTTNGEDELIASAALQFAHRGPGCPISDPAEPNGDG